MAVQAIYNNNDHITIDDSFITRAIFNGTGYTSILDGWGRSFPYSMTLATQFGSCSMDSSGTINITGWIHVDGTWPNAGSHTGNGLKIAAYWVDSSGIYHYGNTQYGVIDCDNDAQAWASFNFSIPRPSSGSMNIRIGFEFRGVFMNGDGVNFAPSGSGYGWYPVFNRAPSDEENDYNDNGSNPPYPPSNGAVLYGRFDCIDENTGSSIITVHSNYTKPARPVITGSELNTGNKFTANIDWKYTATSPVSIASVYYYDSITNSTVAGWPSTSDLTTTTTAYYNRINPDPPLRSEANGTMISSSTGSWSFIQSKTARNPVGVVANALAKSDNSYQDSNGWFTFFPAPVAPTNITVTASGNYGVTVKWTNNYTLSCYATEIWCASSMSVSNGVLTKSADAVLLGTVNQGVSTFTKSDVWSTSEGSSTKRFYIAQKSSYSQWTNSDKANFVKSGKLDGVYTSLLTATLLNGGSTIYWYDSNGTRHLATPYWYDSNGTKHDVIGVYYYDSSGNRHNIIA